MITAEAGQDIEGKVITIRYETDAERDHALVLCEALEIYGERNATRKDNWRKQGWRGPLYDLRDKVERVWDTFWNAEPETADGADMDDVLDSINYAAILVRAVRLGDRDGSWFD
jgi:hypothetical protein